MAPKKKLASDEKHAFSYGWVIWTVLAFAVVLGCLLRVPDPELDWDGFVLPMTNRYMGLEGSRTPLQGVNVVVSGSTSGIGKGLTERLSQLGATVIALGRNPTKLEHLQQQFPSIATVLADYDDLNSVAKAAEEISASFDHIDILINNAGIHEGIILLDNPTSAQGYDRIFSVNYLSHFFLTEKLAPLLNKSERPVVAQMSSSFHWVGDWSDLVPSEDGKAPAASAVGGTGGVFRTQRGYGNTKLAMILHAKALQRRQDLLSKARIVSICPAWVNTNIMPPGTMGNIMISAFGFAPNGHGIGSALYAMFSGTDADYFTNTKIMNAMEMKNEAIHAPWTFSFGLRDFGSFIMAFGCLGFQRLTAAAEISAASPITANESIQDKLYNWSKQAVAEWI